MNLVPRLSAIAFSLVLLQPNFAQKLVDPNTVAPEFRAAAQKRRAEQIRLHECAKKADVAKVPKRDRVMFISDCVDRVNPAATGDAVK